MEEKLPKGWEATETKNIFLYYREGEVYFESGGTIELKVFDDDCSFDIYDIEQFAKDVKEIHKLCFE